MSGAGGCMLQVEALESGVFRADLPCKFRCKAEAYQVGRGAGRAC